MPKHRETLPGQKLFRITDLGERLYVFDAEAYPKGWLQPERTSRWVIAQLNEENVIINWGEEQSLIRAKSVLHELVAGERYPTEVWHDTKAGSPRQKSENLLSSRLIAQNMLANAILTQMKFDEMARLAAEIVRNPAAKGASVRLRALEWMAKRTIGNFPSAPSDSGVDQAKLLEAKKKFFSSPWFQEYLAQAQAAVIGEASDMEAQKRPVPGLPARADG